MITSLFLSVLEVTLSTSLIIVLVFLSSSFINRRYAAKWKYWIWIFLAVRLVLPGSISDLVNDSSIRGVSEETSASDPSVQDDKSDTVSQAGPQPVPRQTITFVIPEQVMAPVAWPEEQGGTKITILDVMSAVWFGGCLIFMAVHIAVFFHYRRRLVRQGTRTAKKRILEQWSSLAEEQQLRRQVPVIVYSQAASPMVLGFFRPVLVLPDEQYSDQELFFILKHELIHLKRRDIFVKLLLVAANAVHWFNPLVWLMQREAVVDMELSCDEKVIQGMDYEERKVYTETLFSTLHRSHVRAVALSTQFCRGKQIMKKRFRNILGAADKKSGAAILACVVLLAGSMGMLISCSADETGQQPEQSEAKSETDAVRETESQERTESTEVVESTENVETDNEVPDIVRQKVEKRVEDLYLEGWQSVDTYSDWRVESLTHSYTYEDFEGMVLQIYQLNYQFLSDNPEEVQLAGGMSVDEEGWVIVEYPYSNYFVFRQDGDTLTYLSTMFENDCLPGDAIFTHDLRRIYDMGELDEKVTLERPKTLYWSFGINSQSVDVTVTVTIEEGYSIAWTDGEWSWKQTGKNEWTAVADERIQLEVEHFDDKTTSQIEEALLGEGYVFEDRNFAPSALGTKDLVKRESDMVYRVRLNNAAWKVSWCFPADVEDSWGNLVGLIADSFHRTYE